MDDKQKEVYDQFTEMLADFDLYMMVDACVEIKILRRVRAESSRRPPRDGASTAASSSRNDFVTIHRVHPTHWSISTPGQYPRGRAQRCAEEDDARGLQRGSRGSAAMSRSAWGFSSVVKTLAANFLRAPHRRCRWLSGEVIHSCRGCCSLTSQPWQHP